MASGWFWRRRPSASGAGKVSFNWYRINLTIPEKIGDFDPSGSTLVLDIPVDDYAEIGVDGELPRRFPQSGGITDMGRRVPLSGGPTSIRARPR
jgi:hypothetical protein